eukprot:SAG31_NODE_75_length_27561_cov_28.859333_11_plen_211_part_00
MHRRDAVRLPSGEAGGQRSRPGPRGQERKTELQPLQYGGNRPPASALPAPPGNRPAACLPAPRPAALVLNLVPEPPPPARRRTCAAAADGPPLNHWAWYWVCGESEQKKKRKRSSKKNCGPWLRKPEQRLVLSVLLLTSLYGGRDTGTGTKFSTCSHRIRLPVRTSTSTAYPYGISTTGTAVAVTAVRPATFFFFLKKQQQQQHLTRLGI